MVNRNDQEFRPTTRDGTDLRVAVSALVKSLRRGEEAEGAYWADQVAARHWKYLFRRLAVFAAEDIGIADPHAVVLIQALRSAYEQATKESRAPRPDGSFIGLAVLYLARAPKNREASEFIEAIGHAVKDEGWRPVIGPEVYDLHTEEGRERMPDKTEQLTHWLTEASLSSPDEGPKDWLLWIHRWAVRKGALDRYEVEDQAMRWDEAGRLLYGLDGYQPRGEVTEWHR